jgi:transcriptional regulator with XRE-family HTH domain
MVICELFDFWKQRERQLGRELTIEEVAQGSGVNRDTVSALYRGKVVRYDAKSVGNIARFLGVPDGVPVPFLVVRYEAQ